MESVKRSLDAFFPRSSVVSQALVSMCVCVCGWRNCLNHKFSATSTATMLDTIGRFLSHVNHFNKCHVVRFARTSPSETRFI